MKTGARALLLVLGDIVMLLLAFFIMLKMAFSPKDASQVFHGHFQAFTLVFGIWLLVFFLFNLYETKSIKPTIPLLKKIGIAYLVALTASTVLFYVIPTLGITPKTNLVIFSLVFIFLFIAWRRLFYNFFSTNFKRGVAFIIEPTRDSTQTKDIVDYIETNPHSGFFIAGIYHSEKEFQERQNKTQIDTLIVSKNALSGAKDLAPLYHTIENILDLTYAYEDMLGKIPVDSIDEAWFVQNIRVTDTASYSLIINTMNKITAVILLILTSPLLLVVALAVKLNDWGPVLYTQPRVGKKGKNFKLYKFRSMIVNADSNGAEWTEKNDNRITKIGEIIRKLHIDEVPQLWNVLKGEMVLVGPRPEIPSFEKKLAAEIPFYNLRHIISPGFTGWAQIKFRNARGIAESKEKFEYDLYYIKNKNIFMDIGIILKTIQIIFTHN